jgi:hypothetical protein
MIRRYRDRGHSTMTVFLNIALLILGGIMML